MSVEPIRACPNCGCGEVRRFCPQCGQPAERGDRSLFAWIRSGLAEILSLDGRTARTLRTLVAAPGTLTLAWIRGERARYTPPLRLYLISSLLFFGVVSVLGTSPIPLLQILGGLQGLDQEEHIRAIAAADPGPWPPDLLRSAAETFQGAVASVITVGLVIVVPATALILTLLLLRAKRWYYVDHIVHSVHVISFSLLVWTVAWPLFFVDSSALRTVLAPVVWGGLVLYGGASFLRVYRLGWVKTAIAYPAMLILGVASGVAVFELSAGEERAVAQVDASLVFWEAAYARYGERVYTAAVEPGRPQDELGALHELAEVVYQHAPQWLSRLDPHFMSDFAELRLASGDAEGALTLFGGTLRGLTRPLDGVGGSAAAHFELGDTVSAQGLALEFLEMLDGGARGFHPERTNRYRLLALEILGRSPGE